VWGIERSPSGADVIYNKIQVLSPKDDPQRSLQAQALNMAMGVEHTSWLMYDQESTSFFTPLLVVLVFWITTLFISFGLSHSATQRLPLLYLYRGCRSPARSF
jgi:hypothetical protein